MAEIWERLPDESSKAYQAFCEYRDMGADRSIRKLAQARGKPTSTKWLCHWSAKHNWVERARAYDDYLEQEKRKEQEKAILDMVERHTKEAMALQQKAIERLRALDPSELSPRDVLSYLMEAIRLERLSRGEPNEVQAPLKVIVERVYGKD